MLLYLWMVPAGVRTNISPVVVEGKGGPTSHIHIGVQIPVSKAVEIFIQQIKYISISIINKPIIIVHIFKRAVCTRILPYKMVKKYFLDFIFEDIFS
jgi:hypothetical protein